MRDNDDYDVLEEGFKDVIKKVGDKYKEAKAKADAQLYARIEKDKKRKLPKYDNFYGGIISASGQIWN